MPRSRPEPERGVPTGRPPGRPERAAGERAGERAARERRAEERRVEKRAARAGESVLHRYAEVPGWLRRRWEALPLPVRTFLAWLRSPEFVTTSSSLAFYALISLPPMLLLGFWIAGWFVDDDALHTLGTEFGSQAPQRLRVAGILRALIDVAGHTGPLAAVAAVWPATTYGAALARAFTAIAPKSERRIRGWRGRLLALALIAILPVLVFSAMGALYFLPRLLGNGAAPRVVLAVAGLLLLAGVIAVVYLLYELWDTRWDDVVIGSATATGLVAVATAGYLVYLGHTDLGGRYGAQSLATAVLLGLWLLLGTAALLAGYRIMWRRARRRAADAGTRKPAPEPPAPS